MKPQRSTLQLLTKALVSLLSIPYAVAIIGYTIRGWPADKDKRWQILQPAHVLKLTYAVCQELTAIVHLPIFLQWTYCYKSAKTVIKNQDFGRHGNSMDVWFPSHDLPNDSSLPVIVFIYGGAWETGDKSMYGLLAQNLANSINALVVVPNYSTYPKGTIPDMVEDVLDCVAEIQNSTVVSGLRGDSSRVMLIGHSAGAHLCALSLIELVENGYNVPVDTDENNDIGTTKKDEEKKQRILKAVKGMIGIGGVYHISDHYAHETGRGVEVMSSMWRAALGHVNFDYFSPSLRVSRLQQEQLNQLCSFAFIHGKLDKTVPFSSSRKFTDALCTLGLKPTFHLLPDGQHSDLVLDLMQSNRKQYQTMMTLIQGLAHKWLL